ncbi:MAG: glycosyltransferase family 2 protein [Gammaproteobacteria bacterium]|nr:glycosyltransferase family 2 protein [Gammaproteobacteria bacterium]MDH5731869.1 glycosyltransferase family 2 protein [Gammaproteobacteria bacterium]
MIETFFLYSQLFFLAYFVGLYGIYLNLNIISFFSIWHYMQSHNSSDLPETFTQVEIPISLLIPAYNEENTIVDSILSLLQLQYQEYEIIVINDGSSDNTLKNIIDYFDLIIFPEAYRIRLKTAPIRNIYVSRKYSNLRVIDKHNGGKADSLNAGINTSRYPLFCAIDADSVLQPNSLVKVVRPFLENAHTVAAGGTVRIANGSSFESGFLERSALPRNLLALFQVGEYLRAFLFGRLGWSSANALLIVSGAFGVFHKETVVSVGGYLVNTIGEDMELIVRLHRILRSQKRKYRIVFVPDPICWTEAPEDLATLKSQRIRWHRGLSESLWKNKSLMLNPKAGVVGMVAFPYMVLFEWGSPLVEIIGMFVIGIGFYFDFISYEAMLVLLALSIGFGILLSVIAIMLEEMSFHIYPKTRYVIILFFTAIIENIGYRQLNSWWRIIAMVQWMIGKRAKWGEMKRTASWKQQD